MRLFIKHSVFFIFSLILFIISLSWILEYIISKKAEFKLLKEPKYLVVGHSHPECAFNDSLIDNLVNLSGVGESYLYTYLKTKNILEQNRSIETIFLEFTNNQIDEIMNEWIWDENYMNYLYPTYSPFFELSDKKLLIENNLKGYLNTLPLAFRSNASRFLKGNYNYSKNIGGYKYVPSSKNDSLFQKANTNIIQKKEISISKSNIYYLSKLINLCEKRNLNIYLIRSPLHKMYKGYSNENIFLSIKETYFSQVEYLDFSKFPLKNSGFDDYQHLNHEGAEVFSKWFNNLIKNNLLQKEKKQDIIDNEIKVQMETGEF